MSGHGTGWKGLKKEALGGLAWQVWAARPGGPERPSWRVLLGRNSKA